MTLRSLLRSAVSCLIPVSGNLSRFGCLTAFMLLLGVSVAKAAPTTPSADFADNGDGTVTHKTTG